MIKYDFLDFVNFSNLVVKYLFIFNACWLLIFSNWIDLNSKRKICNFITNLTLRVVVVASELFGKERGLRPNGFQWSACLVFDLPAVCLPQRFSPIQISMVNG